MGTQATPAPTPCRDSTRETGHKVTFTVWDEVAEGGFLTGCCSTEETVVVPDLEPKTLVAKAREIAEQGAYRMPCVVWRGVRYYHWTWD